GERFRLGPVVLHRDDPSVMEVNDGRGFVRPFGAADLARVRRDDHYVGARGAKVQPPLGEASGMTLAQGAHHVVAAVAVPVARFEPAPLDVWRKDRLELIEVATAPGIESLLCVGQAGAIA